MSAEQNEFANRELDREEIAEEYVREMKENGMDASELPHFTVIDLDSPDGLEDSPETRQPETLDELMQMLNGMFGQKPKSTQQRALEAIMPIIDAGIDVMAMEGFVKTPDELRTVDGQLKIRGELVDGVLAAFHVFGVEMEDVRSAMVSLEGAGYPFKQEPKDIADRLTVWDEVSIVNHLYGPRVAGKIFSQRAEQENGQSVDNG